MLLSLACAAGVAPGDEVSQQPQACLAPVWASKKKGANHVVRPFPVSDRVEDPDYWLLPVFRTMTGRVATSAGVVHRVVDRICRVLLESGGTQIAEMTIAQFGNIMAFDAGDVSSFGMAIVLAGRETVVLS